MVDGVLIEVLGGDDRLEDVFLDLDSDFFLSDIGGVLAGDQNGVDSDWDDILSFSFVFNGDLTLGIRSQPGEGVGNSQFVELLADLEGQMVGEGHKVGSFIRSITHHQTLITSTNIFFVLINVDGVGDFWGLLFDGDQNRAGLVVATLFEGVVADVLDGFSDDLFVGDVSLGGDFTEDHDHIGLAGSLTGDLGFGVFSQTGIEDGV